jgi:predicted transcriptional regulator of viral defense system
MNRYPVWQRLGPLLTGVLRVAVNRGYVTGANIRELSGRSRPSWKLAQKWRKRGWLETTERRAVYRPTRKAIEKMAEIDHADFGAFAPKGGAYERVARMIQRRGAVSCRMVSELLGVRRKTAANELVRWRKRGLLRRTHRDTYRLVKEQT